MSQDRRPRVAFAAYMAGGNATILANLREAVARRGDLDAAYVPVEMDAESARYGKFGEKRRRSLVPGTIRNSRVAAERLGALERQGGPFDAAWFLGETICTFNWRFRRRVPYLLGMDGTPLWYARHELWYACHPFDPASPAARLKHLVTRAVYRGAFHLVPLSHAVKGSLVEDYGIPEERVTVIPPAVDLRRFTPPDRAAAPPDRPFSVLFVGADFERKGGDLLATLALQPEFRDVQFHFVTRSWQGPEAPNVHVHRGLASNSPEIARRFAEADLFALPTRADSHSNACIEAMAAGLPVLATPMAGILDIVVDGETGWFVPAGDLSALAGRIRGLRANRGLRLDLGAAGRRRAEAHFDLDRVTGTLAGLLRSAAESRGWRAGSPPGAP